jgi:hypothetical protein
MYGENDNRRLVTCKDAVHMLMTGQITKAEMRPSDLFKPNGKYGDNDPAYIWVE